MEAKALHHPDRSQRNRDRSPCPIQSASDLYAATTEVDQRFRLFVVAHGMGDGFSNEPNFFVTVDDLDLDAGGVLDAVQQVDAVTHGARGTRRDRSIALHLVVLEELLKARKGRDGGVDGLGAKLANS